MMYYCSIKVAGRFLGAVVLNRETQKEAAEAAKSIAVKSLCDKHAHGEWELAMVPVPQGPDVQPIPHDAVNKLLDYEALAKAFGELKSFRSEDIGKMNREAF